MRILIVDDSIAKCNWIKEVLKREQVEYEQFFNLYGAIKEVLKDKAYNGIILDMQFPIAEGLEEEDYAGKEFLRELKRKKVNIPVLGNSTVSFSGVEYEFYRGKLSGYYTPDDAKKLIEFLENIKEQS